MKRVLQVFPAGLLIASISFGPHAAAQLVFDNGLVNDLTTSAGNNNVLVEDASGGDPTTLNILSGGSVNGNRRVDIRDASIVNVDGGNVRGFIDLRDTSSVGVVSGFVRRGIDAFDNTTVNISGGTVGNANAPIWAVLANDNAEVFISGGTLGNNGFEDTVIALDDSQITITGGTIRQDVVAEGNSDVRFSNGTIEDDFLLAEFATATFSGGNVEDDFELFVAALLTMTGGTIGEDLEVIGPDAVANVSGGDIGQGIGVFEGGTVNVTGGDLGTDGGGEFKFADNGTIRLFGSDFLLDGNPLALGTYDANLLEGDLLSGTLLNGGGFTDMEIVIEGKAKKKTHTIELIPEPASLALLALGGLALLTRRSSHREA